MKIKLLKLFCPLDGHRLQKYGMDSEILEQCYGYCRECKREYMVTVPKDREGSIDFFWQEGKVQMRDVIKRGKEAKE